MKRICSIALLLVLLLSLCGCAQEKGPIYSEKKTGTTCANITMGYGGFAYQDGFVYFHDSFKYIYEYDMETKKTVALEIGEAVGRKADNLFLSPDYILFVDDGIEYMSKDGKEKGMFYERPSGNCHTVFADGQDLFYMDIDCNLYHGNLTTGEETTLITNINANGYYVDDKFIYAVAKEDGENFQLFISRRDEFEFTPIELSFIPIAVMADEDAIYLSKRESWQIIKYQDGEETELPIQSWYYQVLGDAIYYLDKTGYKNSSFPLKKYDLNTGEKTTVCKNVYSFCILDGRYIGCEVGGDEGGYYLIDLETGTKENMLYPEE